MMKTLWKQRVPLNPEFERLNNCLAEDWFLLPFELELQRAHAVALHRAAVLTADELTDLHSSLERIAEQYLAGPCPDDPAEDLHTWIEQRLTEGAGEAGRKIHTARSRNDQVATLLKMYLIDAGRQFEERLRKTITTCCARAEDWADLVFPLQTHCQWAAPGTVGFWVLRFATALERTRRLLEAHLTLWRGECPLGTGAVAGSSIPIDRGLQASELGFVGPTLNALDSTTSRDECLQWLSLAGIVALHLQSLATDVIAFSQTPLSWTIYPPAFGTGSSMMPNKMNPDAMELLRGQACEVQAAHVQAILLLKGLPSGYNRDLQCIKPILHGTRVRLFTLLDLTAEFLTALEFDAARLHQSLALGAIGATLDMEARIRGGQSLRSAHHAVADGLAEAAASAPADDVAALVHRYATTGSASPAETRRVAGQLLASLGKS
ncbi:MAG: hypothetical protein IID40_03270 [Planctomycetes bacterium]|nr:hypothetical protein [Planctomycetota bacterium]